MKKILITTYSLTSGGAEKVLVKLLEKLNKKKYEVDLFLIEEEGVYLKELQKKYKIQSFYNEKFMNALKKTSKFKILEKIKLFLFKASKRIILNSQIIFNNKVKKKYDIEIAFLEGRPSSIVSNHKSGAKKIAWVHTDLEKIKNMKIEKERKNYKNFDKIICVSQASAQSVLNLFPECKKKIEVIYSPIDKIEIFEKSKEPIEDFDFSKTTILTIGRLSFEKGYDLLLEAHRQLLNEGLNYNLIILGEGILKNEFENFIKKNKIQNNTKLLGYKSNPYPYIKNADIFIVTSRYEGYSLVLAEALILGKPIISTDCTGPKEILENGKYGMIVSIENIKSLKNAMKEMITNEQLRIKYSELSVERNSILNMEKTMEQIEKLLSE